MVAKCIYLLSVTRFFIRGVKFCRMLCISVVKFHPIENILSVTIES